MARDPCRAKYQGWHFPEDPDEKGFSGVTFPEVSLRDLVRYAAGGRHGGTFPQSPRFQDATFHGKALFVKTVFEGIPRFDGVTMVREAMFLWSEFKSGAHFEEATFEGEAVFRRSSFRYSAVFKRTHFLKGAKFGHTVFKTAADFRKAHFGKFEEGTPESPSEQNKPGSAIADFRWVKARRRADFRGAKFADCALFQDATFHADARFGGADFWRPVCFDRVSFSPGSNIKFDMPRRRGRTTFQRPKPGASGAYELASRAARERGSRDDADWYAYFARKYEPDRPHVVSQLAHSLGVRLTWLLYRASHHPWGVLVFAAAVVVLCGLGYCIWNGAAPADLCPEQKAGHATTALEGFHFSLVTFTTLGYGDLHPKPDWYWRLTAGAEAFVGTFTVAFFVAVLVRRYLL